MSGIPFRKILPVPIKAFSSEWLIAWWLMHVPKCSCTLRVQVHVCMHLTWTSVKSLANGSLTTFQCNPFSHFFSEILKMGAHMSNCNCAPPLTFVKSLATGSLTTYQIHPAISEIWKRGHVCMCTSAHVQMYPTLTGITCIAAWSPSRTKFGHYQPSRSWVRA